MIHSYLGLQKCYKTGINHVFRLRRAVNAYPCGQCFSISRLGTILIRILQRNKTDRIYVYIYIFISSIFISISVYQIYICTYTYIYINQYLIICICVYI